MRRVVLCHVVIGGLALAASGVVSLAHAGMAVSPMKREVTVKPGDVSKVTITVWNSNRDANDAQEEIELQIVDVKAVEAGGLLFPPAGSMEDSASKWISPSNARIALAANESKQVEFTISPLLSAAPGEYYAVAMVSSQTKATPSTGVTVKYRVASGIFVTIPGRTFPRQAKIQSCELLWPDLPEPAGSRGAADRKARADLGTDTKPTAEMPRVSVVLRNTGRARFDAKGKVRVQDSRAREVFSAPLTSKRPCVFGGDTRLFEAVIGKPLPAGHYTIKAELDYESSWGKARAELPVDILPEQADALSRLTRQYQEGKAPIEVVPESVSVVARPGASRSLALAVRNVSDGPVRGLAAVAPSPDSPANKWIVVAPAELTIGKAARRTVAVRVQVPAGMPGGTYTSAVILKVGPEGSPLLEHIVPVEIEVQAEK